MLVGFIDRKHCAHCQINLYIHHIEIFSCYSHAEENFEVLSWRLRHAVTLRWIQQYLGLASFCFLEKAIVIVLTTIIRPITLLRQLTWCPARARFLQYHADYHNSIKRRYLYLRLPTQLLATSKLVSRWSKYLLISFYLDSFLLLYNFWWVKSIIQMVCNRPKINLWYSKNVVK